MWILSLSYNEKPSFIKWESWNIGKMPACRQTGNNGLKEGEENMIFFLLNPSLQYSNIPLFQYLWGSER
jgi:hypothetical protein